MLTQTTVNALQGLADATERAREAERLRHHHVTAARAAGASWASIARILGCTKQAAAQRHTAKRQPVARESLLF